MSMCIAWQDGIMASFKAKKEALFAASKQRQREFSQEESGGTSPC
jgi:hypothetical protein